MAHIANIDALLEYAHQGALFSIDIGTQLLKRR